MAKKRRYSKVEKEIKAQLRKIKAKHTRDYRRKNFKAVLEKNKIENLSDIYHLLKGMSARAREIAGLYFIYEKSWPHAKGNS